MKLNFLPLDNNPCKPLFFLRASSKVVEEHDRKVSCIGEQRCAKLKEKGESGGGGRHTREETSLGGVPQSRKSFERTVNRTFTPPLRSASLK